MRRSLLTGLTGVALVLTACAPAAPSGSPSAPQAPGGSQLADVQTLVVGFPSVPASMDPHLSRSGGFRRFEIFETLTLLSSTQTLEPLLATEWKTTDPTTWRLTLRKDAKWQDGTPLTADDVAFTWDRINRPELKSPVPGSLSTVASMTAVDPATVEVKTKSPDPILMRRLSQLAILPKAYLTRVGDTEFALKPIGSGPYKLKEFKADDKVIVTRWDDHAYRKPKLTEITVRAIPDTPQRATGLRTGEVDLALNLSVDATEKLKSEGFSTLNFSLSVVGALYDTVGGNGVEPGPIADKRVRQALNYAVDRDTVTKTIYRGLTTPTGLMFKAGTVGLDTSVKPYTYDVAKAKALLAEAGYPNGFTTQMEFWPASGAEVQPVALYLQSAFKAIGVTLDLQPIDNISFIDKIYKRKAVAPLFLGGLGTDPLADADAALTWFWSDQKTFGQRLNDPAFDAVYNQQRQELDPKKREELLKRASALLQETAGFLPIADAAGLTAYSRTVTGVTEPLDGWPIMDRISRVK